MPKPTYEELELRVLEVETARRERENALRELDDRVKKLNCLYGLSRLEDKPGETLDELLQETAYLIPSSWQYPDIACARVSVGNKHFTSGEFEETLLEFAVSYETWESRLKTRLIMEKVIEKELENRITITPEDIAEYYKKNFQDKKGESESTPASGDINEIIVKQLRRKKAEESYKTWIEELKSKYEIEINGEQWNKIAGTQSKKK